MVRWEEGKQVGDGRLVLGLFIGRKGGIGSSLGDGKLRVGIGGLKNSGFSWVDAYKCLVWNFVF